MSKATSKTAEAYRAIETMILYGEVSPDSLVSESQLMKLTGLGRTPVREALQQLSQNRMVEIFPNKGALVPRVSVEAQLRILETRRVLEALAVSLACTRSTKSQREAMAETAETLSKKNPDIREYIDRVSSTHELIVSGAQNEYLATAMAPLQGLSRRFWISRLTNKNREIETASKLHVDLLRAIIAQNEAAAVKASHKLNDYLVKFALACIAV